MDLKIFLFYLTGFMDKSINKFVIMTDFLLD